MRVARLQSSTDIYHVMIRGVNRQILFQDVEDNNKFVNILKKVKEKYIFELFAACLMNNHVHLLIKATKFELARVMKSIQVRYHHWFSKKYDYEGHLFNGRYKSKPVESQAYFQNLIRYIHNNPVKANICRSAEEYPYSSINYYKNRINGIIDTDKGLYNFGADDVKEVMNYIAQDSDFTCLEVREKPYTDGEAVEKIKSIMRQFKAYEFADLKDAMLKKVVHHIKKAGITIAQLRKFTGLPFGVLKAQW